MTVEDEDLRAIIRQRVQERLDATGKSAHAVSKAIGANPGYVRDLLDPEKTGIPRQDRAQKLAVELETTTDYIMGRASTPQRLISQVTLGDRMIQWRGPDPEEPGVPLVGTGDCAEIIVTDEDGNTVAIERSSFDPEHHVTYIERPQVLRGNREAYAIQFHGHSMEPRFFEGESGYVDPRWPVSPGDYVLVQLNDGECDDVVTVLVKRLVRQTSRELVLEQHNPKLVFAIPRQLVARVHRILWRHEERSLL